MDLCKALNYLPRDLLVARLCVYDLPIHVVIFFYTHTYGKKNRLYKLRNLKVF